MIERKSRFIAACQPLNTESAAGYFINAERQRYPDASHHVYAWIVRADALLERFSDDHEPQGTAGRPVLKVLGQAGIENAGIVVTRYFGGTLLGTGGLGRAYAKAATLAVAKAKLTELSLCRRFSVSCDYAGYDRLHRVWQDQNWVVESTRYEASVQAAVLVPVGETEKFIEISHQVTAGEVKIDPDILLYRPLPPYDPPPDNALFVK